MSSPSAASRLSRRLAAGITAVTLAAVSACAAAPATAGSPVAPGTVVTVDVVPATGATALYIAEDKKLFQAEGLDVRVNASVSAAGTIKDLEAGRIDVTLGQWTSAIAAEAGGAKLRAIASGNSGGPGLEEIVTPPGSPVTELSQLKGQKIAVNVTGGLAEMVTEAQLTSYGIGLKQVDWVTVPFPDMAAALKAHKVAAAFETEPYLSEAVMSLGAVKLADVDGGGTENFPITGYFTSAAWAQQNPAALAAFTRALEKGQTIADSSRPDVETALVNHLGINAMTAAVMALGSFPLGDDPVGLGRVAGLMRTDGFLRQPVDTKAVISALTAG